MNKEREAFEESNNIKPDWSFKFDDELQQYVELDHEMQAQVEEFNEHWDTFRAGWQAAKDDSHKQATLYQFEINHLAQANEQWREKAAKAQAVPKWISVKDKLPSDDIGRVLAWVVEQNSLGKCGFVWNCSHSDGVFSDKFETFQVTHWMPLPDAPQESDND